MDTETNRNRHLAPDSLIFDVDGVLIEVGESFPEAIRITVERIWEDAGLEVDMPGYSLVHNEVLKRHGAFNDDYDIAWMLLNIAASRLGNRRKLSEAYPEPGVLQKLVAPCGEDYVSWFESAFPLRFEREHVRCLAAGAYFGNGVEEGTYRREHPLIHSNWRDLPLPVYIYSGRDLAEWEPGKKILGWEDFPDDRVVHRGTGMIKPSPEGLFYLCRTFGHDCPLFFGDTMSDKLAHKAFGKGAFVAIGDILSDEQLSYPDADSALADLIGWESES